MHTIILLQICIRLKKIIIINKNSHSLPLNWQVQAGHFFVLSNKPLEQY